MYLFIKSKSVIQSYSNISSSMEYINNFLSQNVNEFITMTIGKSKTFVKCPFPIILSFDLPYVSYALCYSELELEPGTVIPESEKQVFEIQDLDSVYRELTNNIEYLMVPNNALKNVNNQEIIYRIKTFDEDFYSELNIFDTLVSPMYDFLRIVAKKDITFFTNIFTIYLDKFVVNKITTNNNITADDIISRFVGKNNCDLHNDLANHLHQYIKQKNIDNFTIVRKSSYNLFCEKSSESSYTTSDSSYTSDTVISSHTSESSYTSDTSESSEIYKLERCEMTNEYESTDSMYDI